MVAYRNWHKYAGLISALVLFILALSGFFLDHKNWSFLYSTTISNAYLPVVMHDKDAQLSEAYWSDGEKVLVGSKRGLFLSDSHGDFVEVLSKQVLAIREDSNTYRLYCATDDGIYRSEEGRRWQQWVLKGSYVNAISIAKDRLVAVISKQMIIVIDLAQGNIIERAAVKIKREELQQSISLSRFVRDFHYGRGLFDGMYSLLINDITAFILLLLSVSGLMIWWSIKKTRAKKKGYAKKLKPLIKIHSSVLGLLFIIPMVLFSLTGIVLDHSQFFNQYIKKVTLPHVVLPPVYSTLHEDVWSVDYDGASYRIGNRYGIYKSSDLKDWKFENRGLAYRMERFEETLVVSGMGAPNRSYSDESGWKILAKTPHMFKDVWKVDGKFHYFSTHHLVETLPSFDNTTLYSLLLALHDGTFFASWWIYINDIAAVLLLILLFTGTLRWLKKKKKI